MEASAADNAEVAMRVTDTLIEASASSTALMPNPQIISDYLSVGSVDFDASAVLFFKDLLIELLDGIQSTWNTHQKCDFLMFLVLHFSLLVVGLCMCMH